jgi:TPR repeat protein
VKEYFAKTTAACRSGDVNACRRLAGRLHAATDSGELNRYREAISAACGKGVDLACGEMGFLLLHDSATREHGLELLRRSCDRKDDFSCAELGESYVTGSDSGQRETGKKLLIETCDRVSGWACLASAQLQAQGKGACDASCEKLMERGCDGGDPFACYELGQILAEPAAAAVPGNAVRATKLYQRACDLDLASACTNLAWQYLRGTGAPQDEPRGHELERKACGLGDSQACDHLATLGSPPPASPLATAESYCDLWGAEACYKATSLLAQEHGETAEVAERMTTYGQRGCLRGNLPACNALGHLVSDFTHECEDGQDVRNSCAFAGFAQLFGVQLPPQSGATIPPVPEKAEPLLQRACDAGAQVVCRRLEQLRQP